jgi:guanine deaminase
LTYHKEKLFALKGNIIFTKSKTDFTVFEKGYIVYDSGIIVDVFEHLPERYADINIIDYGDKVIIPGLVDLHTHAPQFAFRGLGMDLELLPWLKKYAFKEERKYSDNEYAKSAYQIFCNALKKSATTHAAIFATLHNSATNILMDLLEKTGLNTFVGKVNMDRNSPEYLIQTTQTSISETEAWIKESLDKYIRTKPILTPRFVPSCTDELMDAIGQMALEYKIPVHSHLSENRSEIEWVKQLHPDCKSYSCVYDKYGLFGKAVPTIMAHCVYLTEDDLALIKQNGVFVAHCPQSNTNVSSGIAPVRELLDRDLNIGLGSDVAAGSSVSIFRAISDAVQVSKLYSVIIDKDKKPLTLSEAFYMATKGGGRFWCKVGSFEPGYEMSAVVIDDEKLNTLNRFAIEERLERIVYLSTDDQIAAKYVNGKNIMIND